MNPYHFDGRDGVRYDASTGLDLMRVRAYGPSVGRFLSRDPLERAPLFFADSHSGYSGASPHSNADPRRQYRAASEANKSLMSTYIQAQKSSTTRGASVGLKGW